MTTLTKVHPIAMLLLVAGCASAPAKPDPAAPAQESASSQAPPPAAAPDPDPWRAAQPVPGPQPALALPEIQHGALPNQLRLLVHSRRELPVVDVRLVLRAGSAAEPAAKAGLADLCYELLLEGSGPMDGVALAEAFADLGTEVGVETEADGAALHFFVLKRNLEPALELLGKVVQWPRLAKADFERRQQEASADLMRAMAQPFFLAQIAAREVVYGPQHPYGHISSGTPATLAAITHQDVKAFYKRAVGPANAALVMAGDVDMEEATRLSQKVFGKWRSQAKPTPAPPVPELKARQHVMLVPKPGLGQTVILMARPALAAGDPDEWALTVANAVFGGMFSSRLNMNLREDKGYTYGARGMLNASRGVGALAAYAPVQADKTGASVQEFMAEIKGIKARPISDAEFAVARDSELRSLPGWFETLSSMTGTMASLVKRDQPLDRLQKLVQAYQGMDKAAAQQAGEKYIDASLMQIVLVGDPTVVEKQVGPLGLGSIEQLPIASAR